ncbi:MAG: acyltransferase domain-containing protein [Myxococcales bacterium]|nr:acyltransferase domain-containing protein [Myxococcales bacterium]
MTGRLAFLFPTYPMRRPLDCATDAEYTDRFQYYVSKAAQLVDLDFGCVEKLEQEAADQLDVSWSEESAEHEAASWKVTIQAHYLTFMESVTMAALHDSKSRRCDFVSGYSMGLYAALVHSGALSFERSLLLIRDTCAAAQRLTPKLEYAAGAVVGSNARVVSELVHSVDGHLEVTDTYDADTTLVTGTKNSVAELLALATARDGVDTRLIAMPAPFHTSAMADVSDEVRKLAHASSVQDPRYPIVSALTQREVVSASMVCEEIADNVRFAMNWSSTMRKLVALGAREFVECGMSTSLSEIAERDFPQIGSTAPMPS